MAHFVLNAPSYKIRQYFLPKLVTWYSETYEAESVPELNKGHIVKTCEGSGCGKLNFVFVLGPCNEAQILLNGWSTRNRVRPTRVYHWVSWSRGPPTWCSFSLCLHRNVRPPHCPRLHTGRAHRQVRGSLLTSPAFNYPAGKKGTCFRTSSGAYIYTTPNTSRLGPRVNSVF